MKNIWIIAAVSILIKIFLSYSTLHPDLIALQSAGRIVAQGNILNLYDFSSPALVLNYPPLIYWFFGLINLLLGGILWLFKLPYFVFDLLLGLLIIRLVDPKKAAWAFGLWMFNPVSLYSTYMMGQFDIIPAFFTVLSLYFASKNKLMQAAVALGFGIAFKLYPVFLLVPLLFLTKDLWTKLKLVVLAATPYLLSVLPYLQSASFRSNALFASQSSKSLYAVIPVSGGEAIMLFPAFLIFFYLLIFRRNDKSLLWRFYLIPVLLFFIFTHFHPQWLIWAVPFLILDLVINKSQNLLAQVLILGSWLGSLLFFDPSLTIGMFTPLFPILANTPSLWTLLSINMDYNFSRSILQTVFVAASFYLIYFHILKKDA